MTRLTRFGRVHYPRALLGLLLRCPALQLYKSQAIQEQRAASDERHRPPSML
jgi:hypothetical protein